MELVFTVFKYLVLGFFGLIGLLFLLAIIFGKRVIKQWEYEAEFRDTNGREFGELDIELSRFAKEETNDTYKATFRMRHPSIEAGQRIQVFVADQLLLEGASTGNGRVYLTTEHMVNKPVDAATGQVCRVVFGGREQFQATLQPD